MRERRPLIAITCGERNLPSNPDRYIRAVEEAGGSAEFVLPSYGSERVLQRFNGLLIPGGKDIHPLLYNEQLRFPIRREDEDRTSFEILLVREAVRRGNAVLGICYGMQLINVAFGGTLIQDIAGEFPDSPGHDGCSHMVLVRRNPFVKDGEYEVNSSHHQAVKGLAPGMSCFATACDGIPEAIYRPTSFFVAGVQWHPERMTGGISAALFRSFLEACREDQ